MGQQTSATSSKKKRKATSGAGARQKGLSFERNIANELGHIFPEAKRHLESQSDEAAKGVDISNTGVFNIQCKFHQAYKNPSEVLRIKADEGEIPVLVTKANGREPMAVMPFSKFVTLAEIAYGLSPRFREFEEPEHRTKIDFTKMLKDPKCVTSLPEPEPVEDAEWEEVESPFKKIEPVGTICGFPVYIDESLSPKEAATESADGTQKRLITFSENSDVFNVLTYHLDQCEKDDMFTASRILASSNVWEVFKRVTENKTDTQEETVPDLANFI